MSEYHDYKEMYLTMVRAAEKAINILAEAQQKEPPSERHVSAD